MVKNTTPHILSQNHFRSTRLTKPLSRKLELLQGPEVKILVGPTKKLFTLPKRLLCTSSTYFDRAFNGHFLESQTQELHLPETPSEIFELVVQFLYTGTIIMFTSAQTWDVQTAYILDFFVTCDGLELAISMSALRELKQLLLGIPDGDYVRTTHIKAAVSLPAGHPARKLVVDACLKPYAMWMLMGCKDTGGRDAVFAEHVSEFGEFAGDLLRAYAVAARTGGLNRRVPGSGFYDPLRGEIFTITLYL
ncbi:BTB POZ-like protein [Rutstroemia sp. NJR-2017a BVV2]|nr:BTB POZ-like protein [Rutstroemia sp. NJR-2017a BVV2]